jgi:Right handed beta helix region
VKSRVVPVGRHALPWLAVVAVMAVFWPGGGAGAAPACDKFASTLGLNTNPGTELLPYRTAQKLVNSLTAGRTGCLRNGTYAGAVSVVRGGAEGAPVTLQSYPGERAKVVGRVVIESGADYVTLSDLDLVGTNVASLPSPTIAASNVTVQDSDITNLHTADCVFVGTNDYFVQDVKITRNRIHDCGLIPVTNRHQGVSVWNAGGTQITRNVIDHNASRGIQLYPNAWRTNVAYNTIDANGQGVLIAGSPTLSSSYNVVQRNLITNSTASDNVGVYWPPDSPIGAGNVVHSNCVSGGPRDNGDGGIQPRVLGTVVSGNVVAADPGYVDDLARDYDLRPGSACEPVITGLSWRPFRPGSPWNVPANQKGVPTADNPFASQFTSYSNELEISGIPNGGGSGTAFAKPIFFAQPGDPQYVWTNINGWGKGDIRYQGEPIPMPDGAMQASGSDGHLTIVTADRRYAYDMWRADVVTKSAAVIVRFDLTGSGVPSDQNQSTSARGSGAPVIPSTIRADEALDGIRHAIGITVPSVSHDYIWPATHSDGNLGSDAIKYGMLFVLRADYPVPADASVGERNVIQALKTYGAYVVDQGASMELDADSTQPELWAETGLRASTLDIGPQDFRLIQPAP